jgi:hypothetical protein
MAQEQIKQQNEETTVVSGDWFLMQKASTDETVKVDAGNIVPDGTVVPNKLMASTGTDWAWQSWTPTWTNLTLGSSSQRAVYTQIGKTVQGIILIKTASGFVMGTTPIFTLPVARNKTVDPDYQIIGHASYYDGTNLSTGSSQAYHGQDKAYVLATITSGVFATTVGLTPTIPFTWGTSSDEINIFFTYEAA